MDGLGQFCRVLHQPVHLGTGAGDPDGVGLLKPIRADHEGRDLAGQDNQGDAVHQGIGQACHGIGRAGAGCDKHHTGFAGGPCIALGHVDGTLFMANKDVADVVLLENLVIDRQDRPAGIAKDDLDPLILQGLNHHLCTGHLL
jgi:hypothetical protein